MWRPRIEVPEFTKCCFCVPLRYGLLAMAYTKLALICYLSLLVTIATVREIDYMKKRATSITYIILPVLLAFATYLDIGLTTAFIVAGHLKQRRGIQIYYYYTIAITVLYVIATLAISTFVMIHAYNLYFYMWVYYSQDLVVILSATLVHIYMLLLLRSEYKKLSNPTNFRFVNNAVERQALDKSDADAILREEREDTESRIEEIGFE